MRRILMALFAGALSMCFALGAAAQAPSAKPQLEKTHITIAVGGKNLFYYLPLTIAERRGYFKDEGLTVDIPDFAGGSKSLQALMGGSADIVSGAYEHTINMQAKNLRIRSFVLQGRAPQIVFAINTKEMPNYKTLADLKGKRIGVSAPGSSTAMMASYVLAKGGLKPSDVSFIGVGVSGTALTAMRSGEIDAIVNLDPVISMLDREGLIKIIYDTRTLKDTQEVYGGMMPASVLYTTEDFIKANPNTVQAVTNAMVRALHWLQKATPDQVANAVPKEYLLNDRALYINAWKHVKDAMSPDGIMSADAPGVALKMLQTFEKQIQGKTIDLDATYTNTFAEKANQLYPLK